MAAAAAFHGSACGKGHSHVVVWRRCDVVPVCRLSRRAETSCLELRGRFGRGLLIR